MYPTRELTRLAHLKADVQWNIARRRTQCVAAATRLAQPIAWLDRMLVLVRRLAPLTRLAAVPLGLLVTRRFFPRAKVLGSLLRWAPLVYGAVRGLSSTARGRRASIAPHHTRY